MKPVKQLLWALVFTACLGVMLVACSSAITVLVVIFLKATHLRFNIPPFEWISTLSATSFLLSVFGLFWIDARFKWFDVAATTISNALVPRGTSPKKSSSNHQAGS
jgi:hypothetical protein